MPPQVHEYESVMARVQPVFKPLLKPHLEDMEKKVAPGMFILTWASMNIDGYLHRFKQVCFCDNKISPDELERQ